MAGKMGGHGGKLQVIRQNAHQPAGQVDRAAVVEGTDLATVRDNQFDVALRARDDLDAVTRIAAADPKALRHAGRSLAPQHEFQGGAGRLAGGHAVVADPLDLVSGTQPGGRGRRAGQDVDHA
jgi:hypothetical protein